MKPPAQKSSPHAKSDAIHRALLTGLLSNVGYKTDAYDYTGARSTKFNIHPGSALFSRRPQWLMAAELVETTKLYARTVAKIQPDWVERAADHLVKRTYSEPHWQQTTAHVVAYEKVTLHGLPLADKRLVHYGPIDPKISRDIFIHHALVEGEYNTDAPFFRQNARLIDEIQTLEAKSRNRDVLVPHQLRFDFYDARLPANIHNGPAFETWRKAAERTNTKLLFMTRRDLMQHGAAGVTQELFPDFIVVNKIQVPLEYHLEPGHVADGVTAAIQLAALNQLPASAFEWLVPGLLREKLTSLIKSLPKATRVNFVPAPDVAQAALDALKPGDGSLYDALALFLTRYRGVDVRPADFDRATLLDHLHMNFKVIDDAGKTLAEGRDLGALRQRLGVKVQDSFTSMPPSPWNREVVTRWDLGDLPESVEVRRHGMTLQGFPALVDNTTSVSLRLMDSPEAARKAHRAGVRRLLMLELRDELKYLAGNLHDFQRQAMFYKTLGTSEQLRTELVGATIDIAMGDISDIRTAMEYELRKEGGRRHHLLEAGRKVSLLAGEILATYHTIAMKLGKPIPAHWELAYRDVRDHLAHLMPRNFITATPPAWLAHLPRFLKAIDLRLAKLVTSGHTKDMQKQAEIEPFWQAYRQRLERHQKQNILDPALTTFRWMIEELRVSLFAQELKTSIPISPKRLEEQWSKVRT